MAKSQPNLYSFICPPFPPRRTESNENSKAGGGGGSKGSNFRGGRCGFSRLFFPGVTSKIGGLFKTNSCSVEKARKNLIRKQRTK